MASRSADSASVNYATISTTSTTLAQLSWLHIGDYLPSLAGYVHYNLSTHATELKPPPSANHTSLTTPSGLCPMCLPCDYVFQPLHRVYLLANVSTQGAAHAHTCDHSKTDDCLWRPGHPLSLTLHNLHCHSTSPPLTLGHIKNPNNKHYTQKLNSMPRATKSKNTEKME
eukprot:2517443-Amphidinium_carterae.2